MFGGIIVLDTRTYEKVCSLKLNWAKNDYGDTRGVDFSPDSTRLVAAMDHKAAVWDVALGKLMYKRSTTTTG
jgi:WD40 repeat protein